MNAEGDRTNHCTQDTVTRQRRRPRRQTNVNVSFSRCSINSTFHHVKFEHSFALRYDALPNAFSHISLRMFGSVHSHRIYTLQHDVNLSDFINFITTKNRQSERERKRNEAINKFRSFSTPLLCWMCWNILTHRRREKKIHTIFFSTLEPSEAQCKCQ